MKTKTKQQILILTPMLLLPVSNLLSAGFVYADDYEMTRTFVWVIGAVAEELFYRIFLLRELLLRRSALSPRVSIVLVSILFAGMHLFNLRSGMAVPVVLLQSGCAFCFSMWAGAVVWKTRSVMIPLLAHVLMNLTAFDGGGAFLPLAASLITLLDGFFLMSESSKL